VSPEHGKKPTELAGRVTGSFNRTGEVAMIATPLPQESLQWPNFWVGTANDEREVARPREHSRGRDRSLSSLS